MKKLYRKIGDFISECYWICVNCGAENSITNGHCYKCNVPKPSKQ